MYMKVRAVAYREKRVELLPPPAPQPFSLLDLHPLDALTKAVFSFSSWPTVELSTYTYIVLILSKKHSLHLMLLFTRTEDFGDRVWGWGKYHLPVGGAGATQKRSKCPTVGPKNQNQGTRQRLRSALEPTS